MDTATKLSQKTIVLHWIVAVGMIGMLMSGVIMEELHAYAVYPWHKSFGVLIVAFVLWRIYWRMKSGWPQPAREYSALEISLSKVVHWMLIIGTIMMPISGMMMSGFGGYGIPFFGLELVAANPNPESPEEMLAYNESLAQIGKVMHGLGGKLMIAAVLLHLAGALKHHFIDKDNTLKRMLGK